MRTYTYTGKSVESYARRFCCEDVTLIENYELAKADNFIGWCCHHRLEYLPCLQRWVSKQELISKGIYYNRPAWELIFMKRGDHQKFHRQDPKAKEAARQALKKAQKASLNSEKTKEARRQNAKKAHETRRKPFEIDGIRFERQLDAAKHFNVCQKTICNWLNNPDKYKRKHICKYITKETNK